MNLNPKIKHIAAILFLPFVTLVLCLIIFIFCAWVPYAEAAPVPGSEVIFYCPDAWTDIKIFTGTYELDIYGNPYFLDATKYYRFYDVIFWYYLEEYPTFENILN